MTSFDQQVKQTQEWFDSPRFRGIVRLLGVRQGPYPASRSRHTTFTANCDPKVNLRTSQSAFTNACRLGFLENLGRIARAIAQGIEQERGGVLTGRCFNFVWNRE